MSDPVPFSRDLTGYVLECQGDRHFLARFEETQPRAPPSSCEELTSIALALRERVDTFPQQRYRLVGVGLSNFGDPEDAAPQPNLFE